ncbi:hypothetical protein JTE90_001102 [Oedothorax gibbosus]|uniref:lysozyme n=1 Tax=Oedothorax gibbosus TaxID=931172 RepID=A0AAV6VIF3_9ARAC|nr:hypothetical protein JTE90_001102 [Oedothorax gibbosus]
MDRWTTLAVVLMLVSTLLEPVTSIVVSPCALADVLVNKLGVTKIDSAKWACLAKYASGFNTQALGSTHKDGSDDFGIFQINDKYCRKGTKNGCGVSCTDLVKDDITPSATCALKIFNDNKKSFDVWPSWKNCKNMDVSRFIEKCDLKPKG